jgi:phage-related protein
VSFEGVSIGTLYAELKLSKDEFDKATKESGGLFGSLKSVALGAGVAIAGALVGIGVAAVDAAKNQEVASARLNAALAANVPAWQSQTGAINDAVDAGVKLGFNEEDLTNAMAGLVTRTHDVGQASDLLAESQDLARLKGIDLGTAAGIIGKVYSGNVGILSRYGIAVDKGATSQQALADVSKAAAGQATAFASTSQGAWDVFNSSLNQVLAQVGEGLLPILTLVAQVLGAVVIPAIRAIADLVGSVLGPIFASFQGQLGDTNEGLGSLAATIGGVVTPVLDALRGIFAWIVANLLPLFKEELAEIVPTVVAIGDAIGGFVANIMPAFSAVMDFIATDVAPKVAAALQFLTTNVIPPLAALVRWFYTTILPPLGAVLNVLALTILPAVKTAFDLLTDVVIPAIAKIIGWIVANVLPPLVAAFNVVSKTVLPVLSTAFSTAFGIVKGVIDFVSPILNKVADVLFPALSTAAGVMGKALGVVFDGIKTGIKVAGDVVGTVVDAIGKAWSGLKGLFQTVGDAIAGAVRTAMNALIGIVNAVIGTVDSVQVHIGRIGLDTPAGFVGVGPFDWNGVAIPKLGYLAQGTDWWRGGLAMLGEQGPELAMLPQGTAVFNAGQTRDLVGRLGTAAGPTIGTQIINGMQPGDVTRETTRALRRVALDWNLSAR